MNPQILIGIVASGALLSLAAQEPTLLDPQGIRQAMATEKDKTTPSDATPKAIEGQKSEPTDAYLKKVERQRLAMEIAALKAREGGPRRFGEDLFDAREELPTSTEGGVADDYVLGIGDQLQLMGFGSATFELPASVDGRGDIAIPKVGIVRVSGLNLARAKAAIQGKVNQQLSGTTVDISVIKLRQVRIFVLGEVYKPGSYMVPSLSSLVNVLSLAGGPTALGTFRQVRVMRGGNVIRQIDLYPLRAEGQGNLNFSFQTGDTIFVPLITNPVLLEGSFWRVAGGASDLNLGASRTVGSRIKDQTGAGKIAPETNPDPPPPSMQFELVPGETAQTALHFAGGLLPRAFADDLTLRRQDRQGVTRVLDLPTDQLGKFELKSGDVLSALPRRDTLEAVVSVVGWVRVPGTFARNEGLRVGELLKRQAQVMPDTYLQRGEIVRTLADGSTRFLSFNVAKALEGDQVHDLILADRDRVELQRLTRMRLAKQVTLSGPFTQAGVYELHEGMRVADLVFKAGIPEKRANRLVAELARTQNGRPSEVRQLDLAKITSSESESPTNLKDETLNPLLQDDDQISVYEKPNFRIHRTVKIEGQVAKPGLYVLDTERPTISSLIERAGGFTTEAMPNAGIFLRNPLAGNPSGDSAHLVDTSGIGAILERLNETKLYDSKAEVRVGATSGPPAMFKIPVLHGLGSGLLNRVVVDFPGAMAKKPGVDLELNDNDTIIIPRRTETAFILGETATPFAFYPVKPGMTVGNLLSLAGGTTRNADRSNIRLLKADGRIVDSWVTHRTVEPGDAVLVPQVIRRATNWVEELTALTPLAILINAVRK